jgi:predicted nicotinamide N-methyase
MCGVGLLLTGVAAAGAVAAPWSSTRPLPLSAAIPTNFYLLQRQGDTLDKEVALCCACAASSSKEALEQSLASLTGLDTVAVEIEAIDAAETDDDATAPSLVQWSETMVAEEITDCTKCGPRSFLLPGAVLARVHEFEFAEGGTGSRVWDAAVAMSLWIARNADALKGRRLLELGSGVGLAGISAALADAAVTLSDLAPEDETSDGPSARLSGGSAGASSTAGLLSNLAANVRLNEVDAEIIDLDWGDCLGREHERPSAGTFEVVVGSDLVYEGWSTEALASAVVAHTAPGGAAYLMCVRGRRIADSDGDESVLDSELVRNLESHSMGTVECEPLWLHNSFGRTNLALVTFLKARAEQ